MQSKPLKKFITLLCILAVQFFAAAETGLEPSGPVNDYAGVLQDNTVTQLKGFLTELHELSGVPVVVAVVGDLQGMSIEEFASRLYKEWGIGKEGVDEGVLFLIAQDEREVRIETGYGSEGYLTDLKSSRIIRTLMVPALSENRWDKGISSGVVGAARIIAKEKGVSLSEIQDAGVNVSADTGRGRENSPLGIIFMIPFILFLLFTRTGRRILPILIFSGLLSGGRGRGSSGFGGGLGSGGFSGFGGGLSGGGGASGSF
ncbi:MAG: TPM domain-containing protein [Chitinivibrionales bacterium]